MQVPLRLLEDKSDTTPGDAVPVQEFIYLGTFFTRPSSDYATALPNISVLYEISDSPTGPWKELDGINIAPADAGKMLVGGLQGVTSGHFIPWIRAKLSAAPSAGSVTANLYAKVFNG